VLLLWDDQNVTHIGRHGITRAEVEEVVAGEHTIFLEEDSHRPGRLIAFGQTSAERPIFVALDVASSRDERYVVTARPMTAKEGAQYELANRDETEDE
jgi:uncharacterized DUF497 family protein